MTPTEELKKLLDKYRYEKSNFNEQANGFYKYGFETAVELLFPCLEALEFYSTLKDRDRNEPHLKREFGCGCCSGINDKTGDCDFDSAVQGLTATQALKDLEQKLKGAP